MQVRPANLPLALRYKGIKGDILWLVIAHTLRLSIHRNQKASVLLANPSYYSGSTHGVIPFSKT
ncbi:MAG TPA: hypothetical protein VFA15_04920 [Nitrososphaera sp.]|nr:hypothetical protein [Nitrososphaera sp.]